MSSGISSGPIPWWQQPNNNVGNTEGATPAGYTFDRVSGTYVPTAGSAADVLSQRSRAQGIQDIGNRQEQQGFDTEQSLIQQLQRAVGGVSGTSSGSGGSYGGNASTWDASQAASHPVGNIGGGASSIHGDFNPTAPSAIALDAAKPGGTVAPATAGAHVTAPSWQNIPGANQATADNEQSAVFGSVKDNAAHTADAAMRGLTDSLSARGLSGAGYEAGQIGGTLSREANQIGEGVRQWAGNRYATSEHRADVNTGAGMEARGQDLNAGVAQRGQDVGLSEANLGAQVSTRGQDLGASTAARGQDLGAAEANQNTQLSTRGQDLNTTIARMGMANTERGQNIGIAQGNQQAGLTARGQDVSAHGIDQQANTAARALAQQKSLSLQQMLTNVMGGLRRPGLSY